MSVLKIALKILLVSMFTSLILAGCGGGEEETTASTEGGSSKPLSAPVAVQTMPPGSDTLPPGELPKEQQTPEKPIE